METGERETNFTFKYKVFQSNKAYIKKTMNRLNVPIYHKLSKFLLRDITIPPKLLFLLYSLLFGFMIGILIYANLPYSNLSFYLQPAKLLPCKDYCSIKLVESIPEHLKFPTGSCSFESTYAAWSKLVTTAEKSIDLAVFYWSLRNKDVTPNYMPSSIEGERIFDQLLNKGKLKSMKIRIAQNLPSQLFPQKDSEILQQEGAAEVKSLNFTSLMGDGVLHTKLWIVDDKHLYLGSANMDWQSLTQVKELGIVAENCSCLARDMKKVFEAYWILGNETKIPSYWPKNLQTPYNIDTPMQLNVSNVSQNIVIASSPPEFNPRGRTNDIDSLVSVIRNAKKFVYIAVMDYFPRLIYTAKKTYWPIIENEIRRAAYDRKVKVRILASHWNHTRPDMYFWLKSLQDMSYLKNVDIEARLFVVPSYTAEERSLKYARVNHNKYMVTDEAAFIGTSNWSGDYFTNTGGISITITAPKVNPPITDDFNETEKDVTTNAPITDNVESNSPIRDDLESIFLRDWNSEYAKPLRNFINFTNSKSTTSSAIADFLKHLF